MKFNVAQATGLNTDQEAALVLSVNQDENNIFLAVLKIVSDDAFTKGRQILSEASDLYYDSEGSISAKLTESYGKTVEKFNEVESFSLSLSVISGKVLYLINNGSNAVYLKRADKVSSLTSIAQTGQLVSGFMQEQDRLFFSTDSLVSFLGDEIYKTLKLPINEWEDETNMRITTVNLDYQGLAALLVDVQSEVVEDNLAAEEVENIQSLDNLPKSSQVKTSFSIKEMFKSVLPKFKKSEQTAYDAPARSSFLSRFKLPKLIPSSGKVRIALGVFLILIVLVGVGVQYKKSKDEEKNKTFSTLIGQSNADLNTALGLLTLNPEESKQKLESAKSTLEKALELKPKNTEALDLRQKISEETERAVKATSDAAVGEFLDLSLIKKDFKANFMSLSGTDLLLLDPDSSTLVSIDVSKKSNKTLAGQDGLGKANLASINGNFAFSFSPDKGVVRVDITNQKATSVAKKDKDLSDVADIAGFGSNIYLLDKANNQIWKYAPTGSGYADKKEYLAKGVKADFSSAIRMQIESSIYILKSGGEIVRFTKGALDNFSLSGLDKGIKDPKSFFASSDAENIYILDSGNSRLVVVDKKGVFIAQYKGDKFGIASDLVVDEKMKKVYLLDNGKIYSTDLK